MSTLPTPQAQRLRPPSWKDARLLVGILLVLASVVLGGLAFSAVDERRGVWAAKGEMAPGEHVSEDDLVRVDVQLDDDSADYLRTEDALPMNAVVDRPLREGELVPRSALVAESSLSVRSVPVRVDPMFLTNLTKGSRVSVFAVREEAEDGDEGTAASPDDPPRYEEALEGVIVQDIPQAKGNVLGGGSATASVRLLVPKEEVGRVLSLDRKDAPIRLVVESSPALQDVG